MSKYTAEQVLYAAQLEEDMYDGDLIIVQYLRDYAALLRERESAKAAVMEEMVEVAVNAHAEWFGGHRGMRAALEAVAPMLTKLRKHDFYNSGDKDCPVDIKCSNGELHTLRCRNCGLDNPEGYCSILNKEKEHPVAKVMISESGKFSIQEIPGAYLKLRNGQDLYAVPMLTGARVPDGWQLVPVEPTDEMIDKGTQQHECEQADSWYPNHQLSEGDCIAIYKAMLAAAPKPEKEE